MTGWTAIGMPCCAIWRGVRPSSPSDWPVPNPCWTKPLSIYGIPYGFVHRAAAPSRRLHRVGDQLAVIPSFSGDGIAIALHSAELAAQRFLDGQPALDGTGFEQQIRIATLLARAARHPILQTFATAACRLSPALLRSMASATRIRGHSAG